MRIRETVLALGLAVAFSAPAWTQDDDTTPPGPPLWTSGHRAVQTLALSLRDDPAIVAARAEVVKRYEQSPAGQLPDGKARLESAVDELVVGMLLGTVVADPAHPEIVWTETLAYEAGDGIVPASRYAGDSPDRIYRNVVVDAAHRYRLSGRVDSGGPLDFSIEAVPGPGNWGLPPLAILQAKDVDVGDDGSFEISIDATPANGRANHLQLPPGTAALLLRDTLADWDNQQPNALEIEGLDALTTPPPAREAIVARAASQLRAAIDVSLKFYGGIWQRPVNGFQAYVRDLGWGLVGINRMSIADDEAVLLTIDPVGARYFSLQVDDLWLRSAEYAEHQSSLNNQQARANADGSFTVVVSKRDPGVANWIDTEGMNDFLLVGRWELLAQATDGKGAVRSVQTLKLSELKHALPADTARVSKAERRAQLDARRASYELRLAP